MMKPIMTLLVISTLFLQNNKNLLCKEIALDSLFRCYEPVYPAFEYIVDSLTKSCPDGSIYSMDIFREPWSEYTKILTQRFDYPYVDTFCVIGCYGIIEYNGIIIYLSGIEDNDLFTSTNTHKLIKLNNPDIIDELYDDNMSCFMFDKIRMYVLNPDLTISPTAASDVSNKYPYKIRDKDNNIVFITAYEMIDTNEAILSCIYYKKNGEKVFVERIPDIKMKASSLNRTIKKRSDIRPLSVYFYYEPNSGNYEIRNCYLDNGTMQAIEKFILRHIKRIIKQSEISQPYMVRVNFNNDY